MQKKSEVSFEQFLRHCQKSDKKELLNIYVLYTEKLSIQIDKLIEKLAQITPNYDSYLKQICIMGIRNKKEVTDLLIGPTEEKQKIIDFFPEK